MRYKFQTTVRRRRMIFAAAVLAIPVALVPRAVSAEGLLDIFFGSSSKPQQPSPAVSAFADPFGLNQPQTAAPKPAVSSGRYAAFCVRTCDGRYFPLLARGGATPAQMCQAFCPASPTKVFSGNSIDNAMASSGERYAESDNAYAYRKALKADCTCNGRDPAGLAPVDLSLDTSLRSGDVIATSTGLVAYSGIRVGPDQTAEFTPVSDFPGLTASVRARLGEMKVAPVTAEMIPDDMPRSASRDSNPPSGDAHKSVSLRGNRAVN